MYSDEEAEELLEIPKHVDGENKVDLKQSRSRINLLSEDENYRFILDLHVNKKIEFKLSLHHQENQTYVGLLRIDYKGRHTNPAEGRESLPHRFKPFIGKCFDIDEPHVHCYVAGYKPLVWALPIKTYGFAVTTISEHGHYMDAIKHFAEKINIREELEIQSSLL